MIKLNQIGAAQQEIVRETKAPQTLLIDGESVTDEIGVLYASLSVEQTRKDSAAMREKETNKDLYLSDIIRPLLRGFVVLDENGDRKVISVDDYNIEKLSLDNLKAIQKAIEDDLDPKSRPAR